MEITLNTVQNTEGFACILLTPKNRYSLRHLFFLVDLSEDLGNCLNVCLNGGNCNVCVCIYIYIIYCKLCEDLGSRILREN